MKTARFLLVLPVIAFVAWIGSNAATDPEGPHGGRVKAVAEYRVEAGYNATNIFAYLYDRAMNQIPNEGITCTAVFDFPNKEVGNLDLIPYGKYGFQATLIDRDYAACTITFIKDRDTISARYENAEYFPPTAETNKSNNHEK